MSRSALPDRFFSSGLHLPTVATRTGFEATRARVVSWDHALLRVRRGAPSSPSERSRSMDVAARIARYAWLPAFGRDGHGVVAWHRSHVRRSSGVAGTPAMDRIVQRISAPSNLMHRVPVDAPTRPHQKGRAIGASGTRPRPRVPSLR